MGNEATRLVGDVDAPELVGSSLVDGGASTFTVPALRARKKWVVLVSPTATWRRSRTAVLAPMLAALSMAVA